MTPKHYSGHSDRLLHHQLRVQQHRRHDRHGPPGHRHVSGRRHRSLQGSAGPALRRSVYYNRVSAQEIARQIQGVGPEHVILSTDFGQVKSPYSDEGMLGYMEALYACGVSEDALVQMTRTNPQRLIAS